MQREQQYADFETGHWQLPISHRVEEGLDTDARIADANTALDEDNVGFKMLQRMGWKGQGLGRSEQGINSNLLTLLCICGMLALQKLQMTPPHRGQPMASLRTAIMPHLPTAAGFTDGVRWTASNLSGPSHWHACTSAAYHGSQRTQHAELLEVAVGTN